MLKPTTVEEYISAFPPAVRTIMEQVRNTIQTASPMAEELISYGMPAYKVHGRALVYFGSFKNHLGFYATPTGHREFEERLSKFKQGKGSVQFQYSEPIPYDLIADIVRFRTEENRLKSLK